MSSRVLDGWFVCLSLSFFLSFFVSFFLSFFICFFLCLFVCLFVCWWALCRLTPNEETDILRQAVFDQLKSASHFGDIVEERGTEASWNPRRHPPLPSPGGTREGALRETGGPLKGLWKAGPAVVVARL